MTNTANKRIKVMTGEPAKLAGDFGFTLSMIEQIRGGAARRMSIEQLTEMISALFKDMPYIAYAIKNTELGKVFRGRIGRSSELLEKPSEFGYRQPRDVRDYGRCHCPGTSMFYCSTDLATVLTELAPEVGDRVHAVRATIKEKHELRVTAIGEIDNSRRYGRPVIGNNESYETLTNLLGKIKRKDSNDHARIMVTDAFFADLFAQPARKQHEYRPTSVLADLIFRMRDGFDGLAYPSVEHRGRINYAIRPESFDEHLEWEEFAAMDVTKYHGFGIYEWRESAKATAIDKNGNLVWESK